MTCDENDAVINPLRGKSAPDVGPLAVMVSGEKDLETLREILGFPDSGKKLMLSRVNAASDKYPGVSLAGPMVGSPYAVLLLETLICWGARRILYFGSCGAISPKAVIGDIILPDGAIVDEGTSPHYAPDVAGRVVAPSPSMTDAVRGELVAVGVSFHKGPIWTTDAIFRETCAKVARFQAAGVLGVEMELSALFSVACYRGVEAGGLLVVSDELSDFIWKPGFKDKRFQQGRAAAAAVIEALCGKIVTSLDAQEIKKLRQGRT